MTTVLLRKGDATKQDLTKNPRIGSRGNTAEGKTQRKMEGWSKMEYD